MNRTLALNLNRRHLLRLVAALIALVAAGNGRLEREARLRVLAILRPAEAAVRRLVLVALALLPEKETSVRGDRTGPPTKAIPRGAGARPFALFDPRLRSGVGPAGPPPRISWFEGDDALRMTGTAPQDDRVDSTALARRLGAVHAALGDLPKQARRLLRVQEKRRAAGSLILRPMRPGRPPGHRDRPKRAVERVLAECQSLALAVAAPDTS